MFQIDSGQRDIRTCRAASLQPKKEDNKNFHFYSPCSGLILTIASKNRVDDTIADTYLKNRMDDYEKYKKIFSAKRKSAFENMRYDYKG